MLRIQLFVYKTEKCKQTADWEISCLFTKSAVCLQKSAVCLQKLRITDTGVGLRSTSFKKVKTWKNVNKQLKTEKSAVCLQKLRKVNKQLTKCKQTADKNVKNSWKLRKSKQTAEKCKQTAEKCKQSQLFVYKKLRKSKQTAEK